MIRRRLFFSVTKLGEWVVIFTEAYTDRHNILLFLMRDTMRDQPVGFEQERRNIFDPEEDKLEEPPEESEDQGDVDPGKGITAEPKRADSAEIAGTNGEESKAAGSSRNRCARLGCNREPRFDSRFCSDSCGVSALEMDLLYSFQESSDIHPSVLRN